MSENAADLPSREGEFEVSQGISYVPCHAWAQMIGLESIKVDRSAQKVQGWRFALAADRPEIIDAVTDPQQQPDPATSASMRSGR